MRVKSLLPSNSRFTRIRWAAVPAVAAGLALAGCGGTTGGDRPEVDATLLLDGRPSAVDAPLAAAVVRGFDGAEGVHLTLRAPRGKGIDAAVRALVRRRAAFAVLPAARLADEPELVGVMALTNAPAGTRRPRQILVTTREKLAADPSIARAAVAALLRGYDQTLTDPQSSLSDLQQLFPGLDRERLEQQLDAVEPALFPPGRQIGALPLEDPRYDPSVVPDAADTTHVS